MMGDGGRSREVGPRRALLARRRDCRAAASWPNGRRQSSRVALQILIKFALRWAQRESAPPLRPVANWRGPIQSISANTRRRRRRSILSAVPLVLAKAAEKLPQPRRPPKGHKLRPGRGSSFGRPSRGARESIAPATREPAPARPPAQQVPPVCSSCWPFKTRFASSHRPATARTPPGGRR